MDNFSLSHPSLLQSVASAHIVFQYLEFRRNGCIWEVEYGTSSRPNVHGIDIASFLGQDTSSKGMLDHMCNELSDSHEILQWFRFFPLAHLNVITLVCVNKMTLTSMNICGRYFWVHPSCTLFW